MVTSAIVFDDMTSKSEQIAVRLSKPAPPSELSDGSKMILNRLTKNCRRLERWRKSACISCYRLYDADIPEYAAAIDVYGQSFYVQEYAPPSSVTEKVARVRFNEIKEAVKQFSSGYRGKVYYSERRRQPQQNMVRLYWKSLRRNRLRSPSLRRCR